MYKFLAPLVRKFLSITELRPMALLAMVLSSLTENFIFNVAAATFLAIVHLPAVLAQNRNRIATIGSASLITAGVTKIGIFTIPLAKVHYLFAVLLIKGGSLAPTVGNFLFSVLKIRDVVKGGGSKKALAIDGVLATALISATLLMSLPLWGGHLYRVAMCAKVVIIFTTIIAIALMLSLRYTERD